MANAAIDLGMEVYDYDPYVSVAAAWRISSKAHLVTDLDELCRACDYLTIHVPALDWLLIRTFRNNCSLCVKESLL